MDRHQPAYWLSRDPAEAADFLARTAVASRAVGGFVKLGMDPQMQDMLTNAALGAGVGGLGGLGVGLFSKRKKNPLTSALTGAAVGGVLGGAVPAAWQAYKGVANAPAAPSPAPVDLARQKITSYQQQPFLKRQGIKHLGMEVPPIDPATVSVTGTANAANPTGAGGAPPPQTLEEAMAADTVGKQIGDAGQSAKGFAGNYLIPDRPGTAAGAAAAGIGGGVGMWDIKRRIQNNINTFQAVQRGVHTLPEYEPGTKKVNAVPGFPPVQPQPGSPGLPHIPPNPIQVQGVRSHPGIRGVRSGPPIQGFQGVQDKPEVPAGDPKNVQSLRAQKLLDEMGQRVGNRNDWLRPVREAHMGSRLTRLEGGKQRGIQGEIIRKARQAGEKLMPTPTAPLTSKGKLRRAGGILPYLLPALTAAGTYYMTGPKAP